MLSFIFFHLRLGTLEAVSLIRYASKLAYEYACTMNMIHRSQHECDMPAM